MLSGSITQGQGHETIYKQLVCDRLGLDPNEMHYVQGDTDKVVLRRRHRRLALGDDRRLGLPPGGGQDRRQGQARSPRTSSRVAPDEVAFADGIFSAPRSNRTLTIKEIAKESLNPRSLPPRAWSRAWSRTRSIDAKIDNFPNGSHVCELEIDPETGAVDDRCATASSTMSAR